MKVCTICREPKPLTAFHRRWRSPDGRLTICIECRRARRKPMTAEQHLAHARRQLRRNYGVEYSLVESLFQSQEGCCAICGKPGECPASGARPSGSPDLLHVDHDHETKEIRGLLCNSCNNGLGRFQDSPELLVLAAAYLTTVQRVTPNRQSQLSLPFRQA